MAAPADVYAALQAAARDGSLSASTAAGMDRLLGALGVAQLTVSGGAAQATADGATLGGTTTYLGSSWSLTVTGTALPSAMRFDARLEQAPGQAAWTLGQIPNLPQSRVEGTGQAISPGGLTLNLAGTIVTATSVLAPLVLDQPVVTATSAPDAATVPPPSFQGWLTLAGTALAPYAPYLGTGRLRVGGTVGGIGTATPTVALAAAAPASQSTPGARITEMGIALRTDRPDDFAFGDSPATSAALLYAKIEAGDTDPMRATLRAPLLQGDEVWQLTATFDTPLTLTGGVNAIASFTGVPGSSFRLPRGLPVIDSFGIKELELGLRPGQGLTSASPARSAIRIESTADTFWKPPVPFVEIEKVGTRWAVDWREGGTSDVYGSVYGLLRIVGSDGKPLLDAGGTPVRLFASVALPWLVVTAGNVDRIQIGLGDALSAYLGGGTPAGTPAGITVERIRVQAAIPAKTYSGSLYLTGNWPVTIGIGKVPTNLDALYLDVEVTQAQVYGRLEAVLSAKIDDTRQATFDVVAEYATGHGWIFSGGLLNGPLDLLAFAQAFLGLTPSQDLPEVELTELWAEYHTEDDTYSARGALAVRWTPDLLGLTLSLEARAAIAKKAKTTAADHALALAAPQLADGDAVYEGDVSGKFTVNRLSVTAGMSFALDEKVYRFEVAFGDVSVRGVTRSVKNKTDDKTHQALAISLHGLTLGKVVEELVALANPNANVTLDPPWSALNAIDLSAFSLVIDPTDNTITVTYDVKLNLGFMSIDTVGLVYDRSSGSGNVRYQLSGTFLGQDYQEPKQLTWDAVEDPPPEVPGKGNRLFALHYLGVGQHVTLSGLTSYDSVRGVLDELRKEMGPVEDPSESPLDQSALTFDEASGWMLGLDATVMDTVSIGIVLHDPDFYGLVVALGGENAGSMKGLEFELLYKKVTDSIGVFRVRLQVPDAFRQVFLGPVQITLGVITVDVFTNGNFMVDLGFPHGGDFTPSFGLQAGPFIGSGGVYFGLLNGATSKRVPQITNGTFSPVIEAGVGLSVGIGRTFEKGPLKAGVYVEVVAIVEGAIGWFRPADAGAPDAMYYWVRGTAGIVGKLYGEVDFKIISVRVSVEAHATVTLEMEAHRAAHVELDVGVSVEAEIKILFVKISFHFSLQLQESFTMGEDEAAPWALAPGQTTRAPLRMLDNVAVPHRRRPAVVQARSHAAFLAERHGVEALAALDGPPPYDLNLADASAVFPDRAQHTVTARLVPACSVDAVPVDWPAHAEPPAPASPAYAIAFLVTAAAPTGTTSGTTFGVLVEGLLRWVISGLGIDPVAGSVTAGQLVELRRQLAMPDAIEQGFTYKNLGDFLNKNVALSLTGFPTGDEDGVAFPIPPALAWTPTAGPAGNARAFGGANGWNLCDATYERELAEQFGQLDPGTGAADAVAARADAAAAANATAETLATFVFRDYALLVARAAVETAIDAIGAFPYTVRTGDKLADLCTTTFAPATTTWRVAAGDDVDTIAHALGVSADELVALNPQLLDRLRTAAVGTQIEIGLGTTPQAICAANPSCKLTAGTTVTFGALPHHVVDGETIDGIAGTLGANADAWLQQDDLLKQAGLLLAGAELDVPQSTLTSTSALPLAVLAAEAYVRLNGTLDLHLVDQDGVPMLDWYVAALGELNPALPVGGLPAIVNVPKAFDDLSQPYVQHPTLPGDTLLLIAATYALAQHPASDQAFAGWLAGVQTLNPGAGPFTSIAVPATKTHVLQGERLADLALRLPLQWGGKDAAGSFRALAGGAKILSPLAVVTVPGCTGTAKTDDTIGLFAQRYGVSPEVVGTAGAGVANLLLTGSEITVPHPATLTIGASDDPTKAAASDLVPVVLGGAGAIASQTSRFLLHGLRANAPVLNPSDGQYHATGPAGGLFELTGQQLPGPPPSSSTDPALALDVTVADTTATWVQLPGGGLSVSLTYADLTAHYPWVDGTTTALPPDVAAGPAALDVHADVAVRHGLQHRILWQSTDTLSLPPPAGTATLGGMPTVWPFSADLFGAAQRLAGKAFTLERVDPQLGPTADPVALSGYAWATLVPVRVQRLPGQAGVYEVLGADTAGREVLLELWQYLLKGDGATVHLAWDAPASAGLPAGLASTAADTAATYLVKTNLSTETHSGLPTLMSFLVDPAPPTAGDFYASLAPADATQFLTLLWECSVVGGGGYWLRYADRSGAPLPDAIFGADGTATLSVVVLLRSSTTAADRTLRPFMNCAVVDEFVDASAATLFASVADGSETMRRTTVRPGETGFTLELNKPGDTDADKVAALRALYSLVSFQLLDSIAFKAAPETLPAGPTAKPADDLWHLGQVIPVARLAKRHGLPAVTGLPLPADDPYAGVNDAGTPTAPVMASTTVALRFRDVLGNASLDTGDPDAGGPVSLPLPVGYTDPVIGVSAWPATTAGYTVAPAQPQGATLSAGVALQPGAHIPSGSQRASAAAKTAARDGTRFAQVYLQVMQPDVGAALLTTLDVDANHDPLSHAIDIGPLRAFAAGACAWLGTAAALLDVPVDTTAATTADAACIRYGVTSAQLAAANRDVPLVSSFAQAGFVVPVYALARAGASVADLTPSGTDPITVLSSDENVVLPLRPGGELHVPNTTVPVPDDPAAATLTLAQLAAAQNLTVASLTTANETARGILRAGVTLVADGMTITVQVGGVVLESDGVSKTVLVPDAGQQTVSLDDVVAALVPEGIPWTAVMLAAANAGVAGLFAAGAKVSVDRRLVGEGETLAHNSTGVAATDLAKANTTVPDLLVAGTPLEVGTVAAGEVTTLFTSGATIGEAAALYAITGEQLVRRNAGVALVAGGLAVPGQAALPQDVSVLRVPYRVSSGATLTSLATLAGVDAPTLATANEQLPGLLAGSVQVTVGAAQATTQAGDSLAMLLGRFAQPPSLADLVAAIEDRADVLASGALVLGPPPRLPARSNAYTPTDLLSLLGVPARDVALANGATPGLIASPVDLVLLQADGRTPVLDRDGQPAKVTTGAGDALNGVVARFAAIGVETDPGAIVASNPGAALFVPGARLVLAPSAATVTAAIGATSWSFPGAIFPLHAWLEIARAPALVAEELRGDAGDGGAVRDRTALAAVPAPGATDRTLALQQFAESVEGAVPPVRVATGKVLDEEREADGTDVWAVAFGTGLVEQLTVPATGTQPQFYALRPLQTSLASLPGAMIAPLLPTGDLGTAVATDIQGADLEAWANRFLADVDLLASAPYATAAYRTGKRTALERVMTAKGTLADGIADGLDYVYGTQTDPSTQPTPPADWASAREQLRQRLLVGLESGYTADAVVQYQTTATSPFTAAPAARLVGPVQLPDATTGPVRRAAVTAGKTSLVSGTSYLDLVVTMTEDGTDRSVPLPLTACPNEVEFGVEQVVGGYASSKWLRFVREFASDLPEKVSFALGTPVVPLPLRAYPALPALVGQTATATHAAPATVAEAVQWDYAFRFQHQSRAQDQFKLEVLFNEQPLYGSPGNGGDGLQGALAQYAAIADDLWALLRTLPEQADSPPQPLLTAMDTFASQVEAVANAWGPHWKAGQAPARTLGQLRPGEWYAFTATLTAADSAGGGSHYTTLVLTRTQVGGDVDWPTISCFEPGGDLRPLGEPTGTGASRSYAFPSEPIVPAFGLLGFEMKFGGLHVAERQNARSSIQVVRNAQLVDDGPPTRDSFVYRTPELSFPAHVTPSLRVDQQIAIGTWSSAAAANPLKAVFTTLFGGDVANRQIACAIRYGFELGGSAAAPITTYLPAKLRPRFDYVDDDDGTLVDILEAVASWTTAQQPTQAGGEWVFGLTLFSSVDGRRDDPLLSLSALSAPLPAADPTVS